MIEKIWPSEQLAAALTNPVDNLENVDPADPQVSTQKPNIPVSQQSRALKPVDGPTCCCSFSGLHMSSIAPTVVLSQDHPLLKIMLACFSCCKD